MFGLTKDEVNVERLKTTLEARLAGYDAMLGKTKYLAGDVRTSRPLPPRARGV